MKPGILRSTLYVTLFSALAIILNLASQLIIAYYFGAKFQRDAYFVAISIPLFLITVINGSLGYIFIPQVVDKKEKESNEHVNQFIYSTFVFLFFFILILIVSLSLFNNEIVSLFFSNYNIAEKKAISTLLLILLPTILFNVISSFLSSLYQIEGIFLVPAIANILNITVNILIFILLNDKYGINGLAIAYLCGSVTFFFISTSNFIKIQLAIKE
jgi:putative peptidoglycan lipid II flippase